MKMQWILLLMVVASVSCSQYQHPKVQRPAQGDRSLTAYEAQIVGLAQEQIQKRSLNALPKEPSSMGGRPSESQYVYKAPRVDVQAYDIAKRAYDRFQSSVYVPLEKSISCGVV